MIGTMSLFGFDVSVVFIVSVVTRKCTIFTYFRLYSDSTKSINPNSEKLPAQSTNTNSRKMSEKCLPLLSK